VSTECSGNGNKETRLASVSREHDLSTISKVIHTERSRGPNSHRNELATRSGQAPKNERRSASNKKGDGEE
jgi:hypothetical protein